MKKNIALLLFAFLCLCPAVQAQKQLTAAQQRVQNSIKSFLRTEGYMPSVDLSDNSLQFKKGGNTYWVYVEESGPFYITTQMNGYQTSSNELSAAILAANRCNSKKKAAKVYVTDTSTVFVVEQFCSSAEEYTKVFERVMSVLASAQEQFDSEFEDISD